MGWRTNGCGCGVGVGCSHGQSTPLCVIPGQALSFMLTSSVPVSDSLVRVEARTGYGGPLVLDMTPFCTAMADNTHAVLVDVPGTATAGVTSSGVWDGWIGEERVGYGPFLLELPVSRSPGRVMTLSTWTPTFVLGESFARDVSVTGMLPSGEFLASGDGVLAPELVIFHADGSVAAPWKGPSQVTVFPDADVVRVVLSEQDIAPLGLGRFTYRLAVFNDAGERRVVLAGPLTVVEGG